MGSSKITIFVAVPAFFVLVGFIHPTEKKLPFVKVCFFGIVGTDCPWDVLYKIEIPSHFGCCIRPHWGAGPEPQKC